LSSLAETIQTIKSCQGKCTIHITHTKYT
jgi:hypothetical protein